MKKPKFDNIDKSQIKITTSSSLKATLIFIGWVNVVLGIIGAFLPLMPTTVFLLIAAACFARSSEKFYVWLLTNKYLGKFILNYREKRGMTVKSKIYAVTMMLLVLGYSGVFVAEDLWLKIVLLLIGLSVSTYILSLKTVK
ncbi:MAG: YbaN family protein [Melioribacteraceae bacterium]|nr:YbaN family protein [Melioribacteraceae bacterium]